VKLTSQSKVLLMLSWLIPIQSNRKPHTVFSEISESFWLNHILSISGLDVYDGLWIISWIASSFFYNLNDQFLKFDFVIAFIFINFIQSSQNAKMKYIIQYFFPLSHSQFYQLNSVPRLNNKISTRKIHISNCQTVWCYFISFYCLP
jgi:hypothetical protein